MIAFVRGEIDRVLDNAIIIDCGNIGYLVSVSALTIGRLSAQKTVKLYTYQQVREDGTSLFGFINYDELAMFTKLITVSGIGPKGALGILGLMSPAELTLAILTDDAGALSKAPGIGKKTAQKIIIELRDKLKSDDTLTVSTGQETLSASSDEKQDAVAALTTLGYSRVDALKVVSSVALSGMTTEQILKAALRKLSSL